MKAHASARREELLTRCARERAELVAVAADSRRRVDEARRRLKWIRRVLRILQSR